MNDILNSLLVHQQVPQFVRDEYPKFISFLEAYYEFLETERFNDDDSSQKNDLYIKLKKIKTLSDIDKSLDLFEEQFFNTFVPLIPKDSDIDKPFLIKNILDLYKSKGSRKSFDLFFHLLYGEEIKIKTPKDNILRASDGRWVVENVLRVSTDVYTYYDGDGVTSEFVLSQISDMENIKVFIDSVLQDETSYFIKKEYRKLVFQIPPSPGSLVNVQYNNFDMSLLHNRQVKGLKSGATTIVEKSDIKVSGTNIFHQLYFNTKNLYGNFRNDEKILCDFFDENGVKIHVSLQIISFIDSVEIVNPGTGYKVGDYVNVIGPATRPAKIIVNDVEIGAVTDIEIVDGGAGFKVSDNVRAFGYEDSAFSSQVSVVDDSGIKSPNTITFNVDTISTYKDVVLSSPDFGFPASGSETIDSILEEALTFQTISGLGPATLINVAFSLVTTNPELDILPIHDNFNLKSIGAIGKIYINNPGMGYQVGDSVVFTNKKGEFTGRGAEAYISEVDSLGGIVQVTITNGGCGYYIFPNLSINSINGVGGSIYVYCLMGDGDVLNGLLPVDEFGNRKYAGQIKSLRILDSGLGYEVLPFIDLTMAGNKDATAKISITKSFDTFPGKWTTSDSLLSNEERRLQGRDYYVTNAYVIKSKLEFFKYKKALLDLIHPAGTNVFSEYETFHVMDDITVNDTIGMHEISVSGRVNINSSIYVTGTNTNFEMSNTNGILIPGSIISINNEIRTIDSITSATEFIVSNSFTSTSNNQTLIILR